MDAPSIVYNFALDLDFQQHLGSGGGYKADVHKPQVGEEEVQGHMQRGIRDDNQDDDQVPKVIRYVERKNLNKRGCSCGPSECP